MTRYVAFLRAINVGGHVVKMDRLRALFEGMKLANVETFIASGNVLFDSSSTDVAALEARIEKHLAKALGYEVATFLRTPEELAAIVAHEPFPGVSVDGCTLSIAFLKEPAGRGVAEQLRLLRTDADELHLRGRELYWLCRTRTSDSTIWRRPLEKVIAMPATVRNATTVRKLAARLASAV